MKIYGKPSKRTVASPCGKIEYELTRKRVKNINLRVRSDGTVGVSAPPSVPTKYIDSFVASKAERVRAAGERIADRTAKTDSGKIMLRGRECEVLWDKKDPGKPDYTVSEDGSRLTVRANAVPDPEGKKRILESVLRDICAADVIACARKIWPAYESAVGKFPDIRLRKMTSQWGNCRPSARRLTFSTALVRVPRECVELVVAHEFTHFLHPDHSPAFYSDLSAVIPDWKERRAKLRACAEK